MRRAGAGRGPAARGLPSLSGQAIRTMIHSRLAPGMRHHAHACPGTDIVLRISAAPAARLDPALARLHAVLDEPGRAPQGA